MTFQYSRKIYGCYLALGALFFAGCTPDCPEDPAVIAAAPTPAASPTTALSAPPETHALPLPLRDVMDALVNEAADPMWMAAWQTPETEADWRTLERRARQLQIAGALLAMAGAGPDDAVWTENSEWQESAAALEAAGQMTHDAVVARDLGRIANASDELVAVCENCHRTFRPSAL